MSEKLCTYCHKPHEEDTKMCATCKEKTKLYQRRHKLERLAVATNEKICTSCYKPHSEETKACAVCNEKERVYRETHHDIVSAAKARYRNKHREVLNAKSREYVIKYPERRRITTHNYRKSKPEMDMIHCHTRRARIKGNGGTYTFRELNEQFERQEGFCYYCGDLLYASFDSAVHVDHMTPLSRGGTNYIENIALSCSRCNMKKGAQTAEEFLQEMNK